MKKTGFFHEMSFSIGCGFLTFRADPLTASVLNGKQKIR